MLQSIGDSLKGYAGHKWRKWFAYLVLGLLSLIFAAWGAYGIVNLNFGGSNYAAEADGAKISLEEARSAWLREQAQWQQRLGGAEIPAQLRTRLQDQMLEGKIRRALITQRTTDLGYRVSRTELLEAVQQVPQFQIGGQYSPEAAKAALAQAGISEDTFEKEMQADVQATQLEGGIRGSEFVTPLEQKRIAELENQEREVRYFVLPLDKFTAGQGRRCRGAGLLQGAPVAVHDARVRAPAVRRAAPGDARRAGDRSATPTCTPPTTSAAASSRCRRSAAPSTF